MKSWRAPLACLLSGLALAWFFNPFSEPPMRVGTSTDYRPFAFRDGVGELRGLDLELVSAYAADRELEIELIPFRWSKLLADLRGGRFDIALGGLTIRPERTVAGRFSVPLLESGAVLLLPTTAEPVSEASIRATGLRIGVNRGGHLERVTRRLFPENEIVTFSENAAVPVALRAGEVDAIVTDTIEAPHWREQIGETQSFGPLTHDRKGWWVHPERSALAEDLDRWLLEREKDGALAAARSAWLGHDGATRTARPLVALIAAVAERLALMESVADAKRGRAIPVHVPEREASLVRRAEESAAREARDSGLPPANREALGAFYRALFRAARDIQERRLAEPASGEDVFDLDRDLRPALTRIGEKIALLIVRLPRGAAEGHESVAVRQWIEEELEPLDLSRDSVGAIAGGVLGLMRDQSSSSRKISFRWASSAGAGRRSLGSAKPVIFTGFPAIVRPPASITMFRATTWGSRSTSSTF